MRAKKGFCIGKWGIKPVGIVHSIVARQAPAKKQDDCESHPACLVTWWRGLDLNQWSPGYELDKISLLYPPSNLHLA